MPADISGQQKFVIITAPSGSVKTSIARKLTVDSVFFTPITPATTRKIREYEQHGREYYFISTADFSKKVSNKEFIEWEKVYKNIYYGTLKSELDRIWSVKKIPLFDIDARSAKKLQKKFPETSFSIYIQPQNALTANKTHTPQKSEQNIGLKSILNKTPNEIKNQDDFNVKIAIDDFETTLQKVKTGIEKFLGHSI